MYIFSTLGQDTTYTVYVPGGDNKPVIHQRVLIRGGAGVIVVKTRETPIGIRTQITDEQYEAIKKDKTFQKHVKNGFIVVTPSKEKVSKVVKDMKDRDGSAQKTPADIKKLQEETLKKAGVTAAE